MTPVEGLTLKGQAAFHNREVYPTLLIATTISTHTCYSRRELDATDVAAMCNKATTRPSPPTPLPDAGEGGLLSGATRLPSPLEGEGLGVRAVISA